MERTCAWAQEKQEQRTNEIVTSLEFTQAKLDEALAKIKQISDVNSNYEKIIEALSKENDELREQIQGHESHLDYLNDQSRRNNLRIVGIPEETGENWEKCQGKVTKMIKEKLNISQMDI